MDGWRFDVAAAALFSNLSRKRIKSIIDAGGAYLNKRRVAFAKQPVKAGDSVELFWEEHAGAKGEAGYRVQARAQIVDEIRAAILHEEQGFVVLNKPPGIASQATLVSSTDTILHALVEAFPGRFHIDALHLVHRLDKDTSGVMLVARTKEWQRRLEEVFREARAQKTYEALCFGRPKEATGKIAYPVAPDRQRKNTWYALVGAKRIPKEAKSAETDYTLTESFSHLDASWITCYPKTGRTHQIRVHLLAIGCPILGDRTYSQNVVGHPLGQTALRQMLHARRLRLDLGCGRVVEWEAPLPPDMMRCLEEIRRHEREHD
jgi:RluA family pseudouridine synthase